jgi:hypothetical protein
MAAHAVLVGGDVAESALTPLVRELKSAGFATVTSLIGPPPVSDPVVAQTSAA